MMRSFSAILAVVLAFGPLFAHAADASAASSPVGQWKTIDDSSGEPRAIVDVYMDGDQLKGKIIKTFPKPGDKGICTKCEGDLKDKPIVGLVFVWGLKQDGDQWDGGNILDPENGKTYSAKMQVLENGAKLKVRGYLGFSLLGRTQVWLKNDLDSTAAPAAPSDAKPTDAKPANNATPLTAPDAPTPTPAPSEAH